jgi:ribonuclease-3
LSEQALLEAALGHVFREPALLAQALTHRSFAYEQGHEAHNERLEFLGDAVLGLVTARWLYGELPHRPEGELARLRGYLVSAALLARHAATLELGSYLRVGTVEERSGGRAKPSLLADALEAVFGALFLDGGLEAAAAAIHPLLEARRADVDHMLLADAKTGLQEMAQRHGWPLPVYRVGATAGPEHQKEFTVECWVLGEMVGFGVDTSKKRAEQRAAARALAKLDAPSEAGAAADVDPHARA